ncbi:DUF692 family multinuclear iron-containing protein [Roseivirga sp. BDSF3-8]|uniref:DUF692 domain-containing protein n=1 Tax=Roseivirga sp. BDSF3-8 TaxID=3241598 RepID=UPI003531CF87
MITGTEKIRPTPETGAGRSVSLAVTYDQYDPPILETILRHADVVEIAPDSISRRINGRAQIDPRFIKQLQNLPSGKQIVVHGVGLSIGSVSGMNEDYLELLDILYGELPLAWHSEHLAFTTVNGENLMTMVAMPRTDESLDILSEHVHQLKERYAIPFLLENVAHVLPAFEPHYTEAAFLNKLCDQSGCGLVLDTFNLECDIDNYELNAESFLHELKMENVKEIHIANGPVKEGFKLDVHQFPTSERTRNFTTEVLKTPGCNPEAITFEILPELLPALGQEGLDKELKLLNRTFVKK